MKLYMSEIRTRKGLKGVSEGNSTVGEVIKGKNIIGEITIQPNIYNQLELRDKHVRYKMVYLSTSHNKK